MRYRKHDLTIAVAALAVLATAIASQKPTHRSETRSTRSVQQVIDRPQSVQRNRGEQTTYDWAADDTVRAITMTVRGGDWTTIRRRIEHSIDLELDLAEVNPQIRDEFVQAIAQCTVPAAIDPLCDLALSWRLQVRDLVEVGLSMLANDLERPRGLWLLSSVPSKDERIEDALGRLLMEGLQERGAHPSSLTRAVEIAILLRGHATPPVLEALAVDLRREARSLPLRVIRNLGSQANALAPELRVVLETETVADDLRATALQALVAVLGPNDARREVVDALLEESPRVRARAAKALGDGNRPGADELAKLHSLLTDSEETVRIAAFESTARWCSDQPTVDLLVTELTRRWRAYRVDESLDDRWELEVYCEALTQYPIRNASVADFLRSLGDKSSPTEIRWRAAFARWVAVGDTRWAAEAITSSLENSFYAEEIPIIHSLARMAFGASRSGRADSPDAQLIKRLISTRPAARERLEAKADDPRVDADISLLLGRGAAVPTPDR